MRRFPPTLLGRRSRWRGFGLAAALLLGGCVTNGDFGRVRPELVKDGIHDWIGRDAVASIGAPASEYPLTDDERTLRDLAFALIEPPYDRQRFDSVWREYGFGRSPSRRAAPFDRTTYWIKLNERYRRSEASAYAQIVTDGRNDVERIDPFFAIAERVKDMDGKRAKSIIYVSGLSGGEHANAINRNNENSAIVAWVCDSLHERGVSYRYALERLVIAAPSPMAAEADRTLNLLYTRIGSHCRALAGARVVAKD